MKKTILILFMFVCIVGQAKTYTTYIPTYASYIQMIAGNDTISDQNKLPSLELLSQDSTICIYIQHEEVTAEKVKAIKRSKAIAGWMTVAAVLSGLSATLSKTSAEFALRTGNTMISSSLATIYAINAQEKQNMDISVFIDNLSNGEIMVNDQERGLTWYVLPKQSLQLHIMNPDVAKLRISTPTSQSVKYATVAVGSYVEKMEIAYEDEEMWVASPYEKKESDGIEPEYNYYIINKKTFEKQSIGQKRYERFLKYKPEK